MRNLHQLSGAVAVVSALVWLGLHGGTVHGITNGMLHLLTLKGLPEHHGAAGAVL
jgi:hypothetical protein